MAPEKQDGRWWLTKGSEAIVIDTTPHAVYELVADLPRMGEWSPECVKVEWQEGATGPAVGARFLGHNRTGPGKRIKWSRRGRVVSAEPGQNSPSPPRRAVGSRPSGRIGSRRSMVARGSPRPLTSTGCRRGPASSTDHSTDGESCTVTCATPSNS